MEQEVLEQKLGINLNNKLLLTQALTHRSLLNENRDLPTGHNERLEFLGDAVLELVVSDFLFRTLPNKDEGELTQLRTQFVNGKTLLVIAAQYNLPEYIQMSKGQKKDNGRALNQIISSAFEAVIGAIYLDQGYQATSDFIARAFSGIKDKLLTEKRDAKSTLQEFAQEKLSLTPEYQIVEEYGFDHNKTFVAGVLFDGVLIAKGQGPKKKQAEEKAAEAALIIKGWRTL